MATTHPRKTIGLSHDTKAALAELQKLYKDNKIFDGNTAVLQENEELNNLLNKTYILLAKDIKSYAKITGPAYVHDPKVLYSSLQLVVGARHGCFVDIGIYDSDTETCYSAGQAHIRGCYEV
jgi:hypothetical protein